MTSKLTIEFDDNFLQIGHFSTTESDTTACLVNTIDLTNAKEWKTSREDQELFIFRADMEKRPSQSEQGVDMDIIRQKVACKITFDQYTIERLKHEAPVYQNLLKGLWGKGIPEFHGRKFARLILHKVHGVYHNQIVAENVLSLRGEPFLVDFSEGFAEKYHLCVDIDVEAKFPWYAYEYDFCDVTSVMYLFERPREESCCPKNLTNEEGWEKAVEIWKYVHAKWARFHPKGGPAPALGDLSYQMYLDSGDEAA
ncbi:hypothetical protein H0H81_009883 [Sphagnurus paluster]|uniref:Uncharacterized protein n=1 Tax=Sphagnurus paluster TaxID=117069 RepID=A0A9P7GSK4_9AGAR|nr:hypothetical protein H0H81_009883 [Sphagnurus paluster]